MAEEVKRAQATDADAVASALAGPVPDGAALWYQKHMCHHMVPDFPLGWMASCRHLFLIRHPARVIASYVAKRDTVRVDDIGVRQQLRLYSHCQSLGQTPLVVAAEDIRGNPNAMLRAVCAALGIAFYPEMLRWPAGPKPYDGVWAQHWYGAVHQSTGFAEAEGPVPDLSGVERDILAEAMPYYQALADKALTPAAVTRGEQF